MVVKVKKDSEAKKKVLKNKQASAGKSDNSDSDNYESKSAISIPDNSHSHSHIHSGIVFLLVITWFVIGSMLWASYTYILPSLGDNKSSEYNQRFSYTEKSLSSLIDKINIMEERLVYLEQKPNENNILPESLPNEENIYNLSLLNESEIDEVEIKQINTPKAEIKVSNFEQEEITAGLTEISDRTVALEEKVYLLDKLIQQTNEKDKRSDMLISLVSLKDAVEQNSPFLRELIRLKQLNENKDEVINKYLDSLEPFANQGVSSFQDLKQQFEDVAETISMTLRGQKDDPNAVDKFLLQFPKFVKVRKVSSDHDSVTDEDILARAQQYIEQKNLKAAISELSTLYGKQGFIAQNWIEKAKAHISVHTIIDEMYSHITVYRNNKIENEVLG